MIIPGKYEFTNNQAGIVSGLVIHCPGCGGMSWLQFDTVKEAPQPKWTWNGDKEKPTLTPSVHSVGCCGWHGYLKQGRWQKC